MDIILGRFARNFIPTCSDTDVAIYENLLKENDPDLYNWISKREEVPERLADNAVLSAIIANYK